MYVLKHYTGKEFVTVCENYLLETIDSNTSVSTVCIHISTALELYNYSVECYNVNHPHTDFEPKDNNMIKNIIINDKTPEEWIKVLHSENALSGCRSVQHFLTILELFAERLDADQYKILRDSTSGVEVTGDSTNSALHERVRTQGEQVRRLLADNNNIRNELKQLKGKSASTFLQGQQFGGRGRTSGWNRNFGARGGGSRGRGRGRGRGRSSRYNTRRTNQRGGQYINPHNTLRGNQPGRNVRKRLAFKGNCFNCEKPGHNSIVI